MKKIAIAASTIVTAVALASAAHAADIAPAGYDWSGFYIGANAGAAWNNSDVSNKGYTPDGFDPNVVNKLNNNDAAFTAGGLLGYNYQMDKLVLGVETDFNYLGFSDSSKSTAAEQDVTITTSSNLDANWFGTIRGRLGFALDNVLIYGTGGAAYGDIEGKGKVFATDGVQSATWKGSDNNVKWGWTVGGGAEYGIDNWSLGLEYLYVDLGSGNWSDTIATSQLKGDANYAFSTVRATVKYRFQ